jgi:predicted metal-dependent peptidase
MESLKHVLDDLELPYEVDYYLRNRVGISAEDLGEDCLARVSWDGERYKIALRGDVVGASRDVRRAVILHEFLHIAYGDLLAGDGKNPLIWNICVDTRVNHVIEKAGLLDIPFGDGMLRDGAVTYEKIAPLLGLQGKHVLPPEVLYPLFPMPIMVGMRGWDEIEATGDPKAHAESSIARALAQKSKMMAAPTGTNIGNIHVPQQTKDFPWLRELHSTLKRWDLVRERTWRREGRIPLLPSKGWVEDEILHFVLALDASGSMSQEELKVLGAYVRGLHKRGVSGEVWVFDTEITQRFKFAEFPETIRGGGGTRYEPVIEEALKKKVGGLVIASDGYPWQWPKEPKGLRVVFLITTRAKPPWGKAIYV